MYPKQTEGEARWEKFGLPKKTSSDTLEECRGEFVRRDSNDALKRFNVNVDKTLLV